MRITLRGTFVIKKIQHIIIACNRVLRNIFYGDNVPYMYMVQYSSAGQYSHSNGFLFADDTIVNI